MDIGVGYASLLEFAMGGSLSYSFLKDFAHFSRIAVERPSGAPRSQNPHTFTSMAPEPLNLASSRIPNERQQPHSSAGYYADVKSRVLALSLPFFISAHKLLCILGTIMLRGYL